MTADPAHKRSDAPGPIRCHVITVSDTRTAADDRSGALLVERLAAAGHTVTGPVIVRDQANLIRVAVLEALQAGARAVILNGGTGITPRDVTPEALIPLLEKPLPGFGELFRALSFDEIGASCILSRAVAGVRGNAFIAALPGSTAACRLGVERILLPVLPHVIGLVS
ncbi:MAG: molybdenum cofactor biosynthesis protein MoaB [Deltaproteobacteria bacterium]|nr:molybdenum cofactor biosynthesis protein MoaB [Deltaproteobacteria bacterium]